MRKPFYEINKSVYLSLTRNTKTTTSSQLPNNAQEFGPEEPVRQWCAYELMRAYGVVVTDLEFEHPVRVASKSYRIDILIWRDGSPWAVVECKEPKHRKSQAGMEQAISYAGAEAVRAEYAVYTNGHEWFVKRRICDQWIAVPDLPQRIDYKINYPIFELLNGIDMVAPLLCKLDEVLDGDDARTFLAALQRFFSGQHLLTQDINHDLCFATDNLLRVLMSANDAPDYRIGKLRAVLDFLERYRSQAKLGNTIYQPQDVHSIDEEIRYLYGELMPMIEGTQNLITPDAFALRINLALLEYGKLQSSKTSFPRISQSLHHALRDYLDYALQIYLGVILPDTIDKGMWSDVRGQCSSAWEEFLASAVPA
ncbi:MAG: type I restriction enzyme HsdR N-terminal domain-containing protein [Phycisphaerales bacterium]